MKGLELETAIVRHKKTTTAIAEGSIIGHIKEEEGMWSLHLTYQVDPDTGEEALIQPKFKNRLEAEMDLMKTLFGGAQ